MSTPEELVARVQDARTKVQERQTARIRADAAIESVTEEVKAFRSKLNEEGIDPANLDALIEQAQQEVETKLTALETALHG